MLIDFGIFNNTLYIELSIFFIFLKDETLFTLLLKFVIDISTIKTIFKLYITSFFLMF